MPTRGDEEPARRRRDGCCGSLGALLVMGLFAGGLWFAYFEGARHAAGRGDERRYPADPRRCRPIKVKPDDPGGMHIPDRDMLIYGDGQGRPVEHLLPPPEQPMPLPAAPPPRSAAPQPAAADRGGAAAAGPRRRTATPTGARRQPLGRRQPPARPGQRRNRPQTGTGARAGSETGRAAAPARLGAQRGDGARGVGAHQAHEPGPARPSDRRWRFAPISATRASITASRQGRSATPRPPSGSAAS